MTLSFYHDFWQCYLLIMKTFLCRVFTEVTFWNSADDRILCGSDFISAKFALFISAKFHVFLV
jgi:hypothetical protein